MVELFIPGVTDQGQTDKQDIISNNCISASSSSIQHVSKETAKPKSQASRRALLAAVTVLGAILAGFLAVFVVFNLAAELKTEIDYEYDDDVASNNDTHASFEPSQHLIKVNLKTGQPIHVKQTRNTEGQLRLVGGRHERVGRLEVYHNNEWGTVCQHKFSLNTAHVACKQLGFPSALRRWKNARFGRGGGLIWLDDVNCTPSNLTNKDDIVTDCNHRPWGEHNCNHGQDMSLLCHPITDPNPPEVRLVGGDASKGTVEVKYNNIWGSICDDKWHNQDAKVICRQLGQPFANAIAVKEALYSESTTGKIWLDNVHCMGRESDIGACQGPEWGQHDCTHYEDAGVICTDTEPTYNIRLVGGSNALEGRVEVNFHGQWGTVCDDNWDEMDAMVVCRELGYHGMGSQALNMAAFGEGSGFIVMDEVKCESDKMALVECAFKGWGENDCTSSEDAGVRCFDAGPDSVAPTITCPPDQPESGEIYIYPDDASSSTRRRNGATLSFPKPAVTDLNDNGNPTMPMVSYQVLTTPPGDVTMQAKGFFPLGVTTVLATAKDGAGNTANCTFDMNVTKADGTDPWEMLAGECGTPNSNFNNRIVNGNAVSDLRVWPWAAYITNNYFCGAELISRNWAITAAHCIHNVRAPTFLTVGVLTQGQEEPGYHETRTKVYEHPHYNDNTINNDIALLRLEMPIMAFSDYVRPVCMSTTQEEYTTYGSQPCYVIGWGNTGSGGSSPDTLQEMTSPLVTRATCEEVYGPSMITQNMICTATDRDAPPSPAGSCQGDSGGPMVCKNPNGKWDLVGITSWGYGCANPNYPDVLARVSKFEDFIRTTIDKNGGP